jgi:hypothetical protein
VWWCVCVRLEFLGGGAAVVRFLGLVALTKHVSAAAHVQRAKAAARALFAASPPLKPERLHSGTLRSHIHPLGLFGARSSAIRTASTAGGTAAPRCWLRWHSQPHRGASKCTAEPAGAAANSTPPFSRPPCCCRCCAAASRAARRLRSQAARPQRRAPPSAASLSVSLKPR